MLNQGVRFNHESVLSTMSPESSHGREASTFAIWQSMLFEYRTWPLCVFVISCYWQRSLLQDHRYGLFEKTQHAKTKSLSRSSIETDPISSWRLSSRMETLMMSCSVVARQVSRVQQSNVLLRIPLKDPQTLYPAILFEC